MLCFGPVKYNKVREVTSVVFHRWYGDTLGHKSIRPLLIGQRRTSGIYTEVLTVQRGRIFGDTKAAKRLWLVFVCGCTEYILILRLALP